MWPGQNLQVPIWLGMVTPDRLLHNLAVVSVAETETLERGPRNMKYKPLRLAAIFFMTIFYRPGGDYGPLEPPPRIHHWV